MNGFISTQIKTNDYIDGSTGVAVVGQAIWGEDVECKYQVNNKNNKGIYANGTFTQSAYEITTEEMTFNANFIRLKNSNGVVVCEKEVQNLEVLEDIQRVRIMI